MNKNDNKKGFKISDTQLQLDKIINQESKYKLGEKGYSFF